MKTYFYVLQQSATGVGGFETSDAARDEAAGKLFSGTRGTVDVYSFDSETRTVELEFRAELEHKVVWRQIRKNGA